MNAAAAASPSSVPTRVIEVEDLTRTFGSFRAVDHIRFHVDQGEVFGFLGANGAGKSTTIRILCGLLAPTEAKGHVLGYDILTESEKLKPHVGYMSQKFSLYPDLTVNENLDFFGGVYGVPTRKLRERKAWAVRMAGLQGLERSITGTLAGGFKQRLALGAALLHEPKLLFLDEPTAGVAPEARRFFWDLIRALAHQGTTVFVTTHYMDEVEHCDLIALMSRGRIAALDTPSGLKKDAMGGRLVRFESPHSLSELRRKNPAFLDLQPFGTVFHALMPLSDDPLDAFRTAARAAGIEVRSETPVEPTLEDVFIAVIGRKER